LAANGCAGATKRADKSLSTILAATNAARDSFTVWDTEHQQQIVEAAATKDAGRTNLARYREKRATVLKAFVVAYQSLASAAVLVPLIERGERKQGEFDAYLTEAFKAILVIKESIGAIK